MMNIKRMPSCIAVVVAALLLAVSCGNMLEAPKAEGVEGGMGRLSVSMGDGRAVFPEELKFEEDKELTFTLSGSLSGGEGKEIRSWTAEGDKTAYQVMVADTSLTVEAGQWSFTLQAKRGGTVVATASKDLEVRGGTTNKLSFGTMDYSDEGTGTVTVTLSWNEVEEVTSVVAGLYHRDSGELVSGTEVTFDTIEGAQVTYKQNVSAGTYRLKAQMYQDDAVIGTYSELVRVAGGLSSEAERNLESLNTLYTVTLDFGEEGSLSTGSSFPETYNRSQTVTLPTADQVASTTGAVFLHWYEKDDTEKKAVTQIPGLDGDKTYCAYWQVAPVTFSPDDVATLYYGDTVTLSTSTDGATIQYKLDDGEWMDYTEETPISVTTFTTITARATKDGFKDSEETKATYTVRKLEGITVTSPAQTVYSERQSFDPTGMVVTATYDDKSQREVTGWETDFNTVAGEKGLGKTVTVSYREGNTTQDDTFTVDVVNVEEPTILTTYTSPNNTDGSWTYMAFGEWPQTIKDASVNVYESEGKEMGMFTYYLGSDGNHYVKAEEKANGAGYKYSNGEQAGQGGTSTNWFKVEPIVWRVLNKDYASTNKALLLAEKILTGGIKWGAAPSNNYMQSYIRQWLNGNNGDAGFLQTAFTQSARGKIADTSVDNSAASTTDKIFLLSDQEATNSEYGFGAYNDSDRTRIRVTTDYAKATGALQEDSLAGYGGWWGLRSPGHIDNIGGKAVVRFIFHNGQVADVIVELVESDLGVVPALSISL